MHKRVAAAAVAGSLLAGAGLGFALFGPSSAGAQTSSSSSSEAPAGPKAHHGHPGPDLAVAAKAIGISEDDLRSAIESGQTIAQVAQAHGVDPQTVIDAMVAAAQTDLQQNITDFVNNTPQHGPEGHGRGPGHGMGFDLAAAAKAIGISEDDLRSAVESGQTIAQVAQAHGVDPQTVVDAIVADAGAKIDAAVAAGRLTQQQADDQKSHLPDIASHIVNDPKPQGPPPWAGHPGNGGPPDHAPDQDSDDASSTSSSS